MDTTPNLSLAYIAAAQAQKHVTHNEALRALDAIVQLMVLDKDLAAPPGSPAAGARYIVASSPTGAWSGQAGRVAAWQDDAWAFYTPRQGWLAWVADEDTLYTWSGAAWAAFAAGSLDEVVEDTTPELGGDLDANGHSIAFDDVLRHFVMASRTPRRRKRSIRRPSTSPQFLGSGGRSIQHRRPRRRPRLDKIPRPEPLRQLPHHHLR